MLNNTNLKNKNYIFIRDELLKSSDLLVKHSLD